MGKDHGSNGLQAFTRSGVSDELMGVFEGLRASPGSDGNYKFRPQDIDTLASAIICRNYKGSCLQLSYLLLAVQHACVDELDSPLLNFFWIEEAITPMRFRQAMAQPYADERLSVSLGSQFLHITLEQKSFDISPTRIGLLAALLEFLVHIHLPCLEQASILRDKPSRTRVENFASSLQSAIYDYLRPHLKPAQQQRRFRFIWHWLQQQNSLVISDETVFDFWQEMALLEDDKLGFRRFRTVAQNFFELRQALIIGRDMLQLQHAASIGADKENDEISPEQLFEALQSSDDDGESIDFLAQAPKFLTAKELNPLRPIMAAGKSAQALPLTLARASILGNHQEAIRQAIGKNAPRLKQLLQGPLTADYASYIEQLKHRQQDLEQALLAGLHVLLERQQSEALELLLPLLSEQAATVLRAELAEVNFDQVRDDIELGAFEAQVNALVTAFYGQLPALCLRLPALKQLVQSAQLAAKHIKGRAGFKRLPAPNACQPYVLGMECMQRLERQLGDYLSLIQSQTGEHASAQKNFSADLSIAMGIFQRIYGDLL